VSCCLDELAGLGLPEDVLDQVLHENAARILAIT
jgi:predicted TIM-barrel fold metal-dependent hydrolase